MSAELEFRVAGVHTSRSSNEQKPEVQLSTSTKRGFWFSAVRFAWDSTNLLRETPLRTIAASRRNR